MSESGRRGPNNSGSRDGGGAGNRGSQGNRGGGGESKRNAQGRERNRGPQRGFTNNAPVPAYPSR